MTPFLLLSLSLVLPSLSLAAPEVKGCNEKAILANTTYTVLSSQTLNDIATVLGRSACDIARVNRMADPNYITVGESLLIPKFSCNPDDTSCFLEESTNPRDCVFGGPHTYIAVLNDTIRYVALYKLNITVDALQNGGPSATNRSDPDAIITAGLALKVPVCANSECTLKPHAFNYGVLRDLADEFDTTVGQIEAINSGYYHSDAADEGPTLVLPVNCRCPKGHNCTEVLT